MAKEELRRCKECATEWRAVKVTKRDAKQPPIVGRGFTKRSQALHRQTMHEQKIADHQRWARCSSCGSQNVETIKKSKKADAGPAPTPAAATPPPPPPTPAAWAADPFGRHEHRYWDGTAWTENVSDGGVQSTDPAV